MIDVVAFQQRARRRMAHAVDLLVDGGFLLDIGVGARDVGLRLVVVVIGDEVLDRVVGEERLELAIELRRQRLVRRQDQRRALRRLDDLGHRESLAGAGDAEQHLRALAAPRGCPRRARRSPSAGRLLAVVGDRAERDSALALLRPRRPMRHPGLVAEFRPPALDQRGERLHRRGDARLRQRLGFFQRNVEARDRHQPRAGALLRGAAPAHGGAARRLQRFFDRRGVERQAAIRKRRIAPPLHPPLRPGFAPPPPSRSDPPRPRPGRKNPRGTPSSGACGASPKPLSRCREAMPPIWLESSDDEWGCGRSSFAVCDLEGRVVRSRRKPRRSRFPLLHRIADATIIDGNGNVASLAEIYADRPTKTCLGISTSRRASLPVTVMGANWPRQTGSSFLVVTPCSSSTLRPSMLTMT